MAPTKEEVSNNIPDDLILIILSKLPVKSLKRFNCVCKFWADLFENPQFMSLYRNNFLSKDDNDNSCLLLKQSMPNTHHENLFLLSDEGFENRVKLDCPLPFQDDETNIFILGSVVNGTLCLYQGSDDAPAPEIALKVVLWNPSTDEFKVIPPGSVDCPLDIDICVYLHGFGYDHLTDDYKLIRFFYFFEHHYCGDDFPEPLWQIYSLRSDSWSKLDVEMPTSHLRQNEVYLNGVCHWWGYKQPDEHLEEVLVSFNLSDEVFHTTPLDRNGCYAGLSRHLAVLKGSIAIISRYADTPCFDISVLGELGVMESWTKLFSIGPLPCVERPIGVGKKGHIFFRKNDDELARFDLSSQMMEEIGVKGEYACCQILIYKESLLPIGGINN